MREWLALYVKGRERDTGYMPTVGYWGFVMKLGIAKWRRPEGSIDSDPASGWTNNLPCEGVSKTDPAPGWAFHSSRRQLGYLPISYVTPTSA